MKSNMWKSTTREIKQSIGRFLAILAIVALGVGLFSGLKVTQPAMVKTVNQYLTEKQFYDYRILSTLGFEQEDVDFLAKQKDVRYAEGVFNMDVLCNIDGENEMVLKAYNLPEDINGIELMEGRMPKNAGECLVDSSCFTEKDIGKTLVLSDTNDEDDLECFTKTEYTIVGLAQSSNYIQFERGNTSLGNGRISGFMYLPWESFDTDYYTEILVKFDQDYEIYSDEYDAYMDDKEEEWEDLAKEAAEHHYARILADAEEKLNDAEQELADGRAEGEAELADARAELEEAKAKLEDADRKIADAKKELADGQKELDASRSQLQNAESELAQNEAVLNSSAAELESNWALLVEKEAQAAEGRQQLESSQTQLNENKAALEAGQNQLNEAQDQVSKLQHQVNLLDVAALDSLPEKQKEAILAPLEKAVDELLSGLSEGSTGEGTDTSTLSAAQRIAIMNGKLAGASAAIAQKQKEITNHLEQIQTAQETIDAQRQNLDDADAQLAAVRAQLEAAQKELDSGKAQIESGKKQIAESWNAFFAGEAEIESGKAEIAKNEAELQDGWQEYNDGLAEYAEGYQEFVDEIADAEKKIADAREEIEDLASPESYLLDRNTNVGYACFESDSAIINGIANVFPVFFFAVAALVCITTMSRMIEEQRTQIGVLKALGYSKSSIMGKYLFYSSTAAVLGCLIGFFGGTWLFPNVIWYAYGMMYDVGKLSYVLDWQLGLISLIVSVACSAGTTFLTCRKELGEVAAELMRPKAPKAGKRVLLERVPFIWKRLKFLYKVSYRNVFRYKKRFLMMVIGISGCTALLVTGFGINDSVTNIASDQYDNIQIYDMSVTLADEAEESTKAEIKKSLGKEVSESIYVMEKSMDLVHGDQLKGINLVAVDEKEDISPFVHLRDPDGKEIAYPGEGECILSEAIAENYEIEVGDTITLQDENHETMELKVSGIFENHIRNYVYMTTQTYEKYMGEDASLNAVYINASEKADVHQLSADLMKMDEVTNVTVSEDTKTRFASMMNSMNLVVVVIIVCAAGLAFIVLYNLTNINITERIKEIATIKVLGFYRNETASYVFRENMILTFIGTMAGLVLGKYFHMFVMSQVKVDQVAFDVRIAPISYVYSILLTFAFAWFVDLVMNGKLKRISMAESLKSVD